MSRTGFADKKRVAPELMFRRHPLYYCRKPSRRPVW